MLVGKFTENFSAPKASYGVIKMVFEKKWCDKNIASK